MHSTHKCMYYIYLICIILVHYIEYRHTNIQNSSRKYRHNAVCIVFTHARACFALYTYKMHPLTLFFSSHHTIECCTLNSPYYPKLLPCRKYNMHTVHNTHTHTLPSYQPILHPLLFSSTHKLCTSAISFSERT